MQRVIEIKDGEKFEQIIINVGSEADAIMQLERHKLENPNCVVELIEPEPINQESVVILPYTDFSYNRLKAGHYSVKMNTDKFTPEKLIKVDNLFNSSGIILVKNCDVATNEEIEMLDAVDPDEFGGKGKSQAQRLKHRLYRLWEKNPEGMTSSEHYKFYTEKVLDWVSKLIDKK